MSDGQPLKRCFVICPIGADDSPERKHSNDVFHFIIEPATKECGYVAERSSDSNHPGLISTQIVGNLIDDDLVIADLSFRNPNVFYELAIRHMFRLPLVMMIEKSTPIPFDVSHSRMIRFLLDLHGANEAREQLVRQIRQIEESKDVGDNPISAALDMRSLRADPQPEQRRDAAILERLEGLSLDIQSLSYKLQNPEQGHYIVSYSGTSENVLTTLHLEDSTLPEAPPFTKWFAESSPGWFMELLKENEITPRRQPLKEYWEEEAERRRQEEEASSE